MVEKYKEPGMKRTKSILKEEFYWTSESDSEIYRTFTGMVNNNNGLYKSSKQAAFVKRHYGWGAAENTYNNTFRSDVAAMKNFFGIDLEPGQKAIGAGATAVWAKYGSRGQRPISWYFVVDDFGVVAKYKLKYVGDMRQGTGPDPKKTTKEWQRDPSVDTSALTADMAAAGQAQAQKDADNAVIAARGKHVGQEKERMRGVAVTIEGSWGPKTSDWGSYYINKMRDPDGHALLHFGNKLGNTGDKINITYTVKKHDKDSRTGEPITIINRPKVAQ